MDEAKAGKAQPEQHPILRAKRVKGEVDWVALIDEHIKRYPNILGALAQAERRCAERKQRE